MTNQNSVDVSVTGNSLKEDLPQPGPSKEDTNPHTPQLTKEIGKIQAPLLVISDLFQRFPQVRRIGTRKKDKLRRTRHKMMDKCRSKIVHQRHRNVLKWKIGDTENLKEGELFAKDTEKQIKHSDIMRLELKMSSLIFSFRKNIRRLIGSQFPMNLGYLFHFLKLF